MIAPVAGTSARTILVLCTHNSVRSPMAQAMLRKILGSEVELFSAGIEPEDEVHVMASSVMQEKGFDISGHKPVDYETLQDRTFDLVIALSRQAYEFLHRAKTDRIKEVEYWDVSSPPFPGEVSREQMMEAFRRIREELAIHIANRFGTSP